MSIYSKIIDLQKLHAAWQHVKRNRPASGMDEVTYEDFDGMAKTELKKLNRELLEHRYQCSPVKMVPLYKGEKVRWIALFCMRDKVVQQSVAQEISQLYDPYFSACTYAYRPGKSALIAIEKIEDAAREREYVLKLDITGFFDNIDQKRLLGKLRERIKEEDLIDLIGDSVRVCALDKETGELQAHTRGVYQGSSIAPVLSNIYLMDFDNEFFLKAPFFVRYSDDMIFMADSEEEIRVLMQDVRNYLEMLGLSFQQEKTELKKVDEGFTFLGYYFDKHGKRVTDKAENSLRERLEVMWFTCVNDSAGKKLSKAIEIIGGWEQYYRQERQPGDILEYAATLYLFNQKAVPQAIRDLENQRFDYDNQYADLLFWFSEYWEQRDERQKQVREFEQFFQCDELDADVAMNDTSALFGELLANYKNLAVRKERQTLEELVQIYSDMRCYNKAAFFQDMQNQLDESKAETAIASIDATASGVDFKPSSGELDIYMSLFIGREDIYSAETCVNEKRTILPVFEALTSDVVKKHLAGRITAGTYIRRPNDTVSFMVLDIDISKKILLSVANDKTVLNQYIKKAAETSLKIKKMLLEMGLQTYVEFSGYRGYHIWIFFSEWISVRYANLLQDIMESRITKEGFLNDDLKLEFFPNKGRLKKGMPGQCIKLPYGIHTGSAGLSYFVDKTMQPIEDIGKFMKNAAKYSTKAVRRIISEYKPEENTTAEELREVDTDISEFGPINDSIRIVLSNCVLMRYLCQKAKTTGFLGHFERLSVLHVFGHMGEDGKSFVHKVMSFTINYQYHITEKFIKRIPEKPVSCVKLREGYKTITSEYGCSCNFKRTKECYPSPVLHAIKNSDADTCDITIPTSRTVSKEKEKQVYGELNVQHSVQELSGKIVELKKQKRGIDKEIIRYEKQLEEIFDGLGIDSMEIPIGLLSRKSKQGGGYDWVVEL